MLKVLLFIWILINVVILNNIGNDIFGDSTRRKSINSREKGCKNELVLSKVLEKWTGQQFSRTPSSGGLRWFDAPDVVGDVVCCNRKFYFPFAVETKHYKSVFVTGKLRENSLIYTFWAQAERDAIRANKHPLLFVRSNKMPVGEYYTFFSLKLAEALCKEFALATQFHGNGIEGCMASDFFKIKFYKLSSYVKKQV